MTRYKVGWIAGISIATLLIVASTLLLHTNSPVPVGALLVPGTQSSFSLSNPWQSGHEVLAYNGSGAYLVNVTTGAKVPMSNFGNYGRIYTDGIRFSPDGKWLLWATGTDATPIYMATQVPKGRCVQRPRSRQSDPYQVPVFAWLPDGKRWEDSFIQNGRPYVHIYSVDTPRVETMSAGSINLPNTLRVQASYGTSLPLSAPQMQDAERVISPDGSEVAWFTTANDNSINFSYFIKSLLTLGRIPHGQIQRHSVSLWVSRTDGSNARQTIPNFTCETGPVNLCWSPNGKHLSFYYSIGGLNALWVAPVTGAGA